MSNNNWIAVISCILIILATLFGRWWILHRLYRKQNNTKPESLNQAFEQPSPFLTVDEARNVASRIAAPKLDLLTSAKDHAHPNDKHHMLFKNKRYSSEMKATVFNFTCIYCNFKAKIKVKDFWGKPKPAISHAERRWEDLVKRRVDFDMHANMIYLAGENPTLTRLAHQGREIDHTPPEYGTDRSDAMLMTLLAFAENIKQPITNPSQDPRYKIVQRMMSEGLEKDAQALEEKIWDDIGQATSGPNPDRTWAQDRLTNSLQEERRMLGLE